MLGEGVKVGAVALGSVSRLVKVRLGLGLGKGGRGLLDEVGPCVDG